MDIAVPRDEILTGLLDRIHKWVPDLDADIVRTSVAIAEFVGISHDALGTHYGRFGLSRARFSALMLLYHCPDRSWNPSLLADTLGVRRPTMTGIVQVLERDRWLLRRRDVKDDRKTLLAFTDSGRRRFRRILPNHFAWISVAYATVSLERLSGFRQAIHGMHQVMDALAMQAEKGRTSGAGAHALRT